MQPRLILDSAVLMNPISFAVHLAAFSEPTRPLGIAVAGLWEELDRRYSLLTLADIIPWFHANLDRCLAQTLHVDQYAAPDATLALLLAATHLGIARPTCTSDSMAFLRRADWASYLGDSLGPEWNILEIDKHLGNECWQIALRLTSAESGKTVQEIEESYQCSRRWEHRPAQDYLVADRARALSVVLMEAFAGLRSGASLSTPNPLLRNILVDNADSAGLLVPPDQLPFQALIEQVVVQTDTTTVRDIVAIAELRRLATLLGGAERAIELMGADLAKRELAKDSALFVLGLVPVLDQVATAMEGAELIRRFWRERKEAHHSNAKHLLYFSSTYASNTRRSA